MPPAPSLEKREGETGVEFLLIATFSRPPRYPTNYRWVFP